MAGSCQCDGPVLSGRCSDHSTARARLQGYTWIHSVNKHHSADKIGAICDGHFSATHLLVPTWSPGPRQLYARACAEECVDFFPKALHGLFPQTLSVSAASQDIAIVLLDINALVRRHRSAGMRSPGVMERQSQAAQQ